MDFLNLQLEIFLRVNEGNGVNHVSRFHMAIVKIIALRQTLYSPQMMERVARRWNSFYYKYHPKSPFNMRIEMNVLMPRVMC